MSRTLLLPLRLASMPVSLFIAPMSAILSSLLFYTAATMYNLKTLRLASSYVTCPTSSFRRRKVAPLFSSTVVFMCFEECGTVFDMLSLVYVPDYRLTVPNIKTSIGKCSKKVAVTAKSRYLFSFPPTSPTSPSSMLQLHFIVVGSSIFVVDLSTYQHSSLSAQGRGRAVYCPARSQLQGGHLRGAQHGLELLFDTLTP